MNFNTEASIVLVVDDVPENLAVLHDALDESGYTVLVARLLFSWRQVSKPSMPGMMASSRMMCGTAAHHPAGRHHARHGRL
jgi:DNA-binding response OmpR family regulator